MQTIAIDFDGVIHKYSKGWSDGSVYDIPVEGVFETIQELMETHTVFVFSTRKPKQIREWLLQHVMEQYFGDDPHDPKDWSWGKYGFTIKVIPWWVKFWNKKNVLGITRRKLPAMCYIDDRAIQFKGDWNRTLTDIKNFKTYQENEKATRVAV